MSSEITPPQRKKSIAFSVDVDDFPGSEPGVEWLLDELGSRRIAATFFFTGNFAARAAALASEARAKGHEIGCHGLAHGLDWDENFGTQPEAELLLRLQRATQLIEEAAGARPTGFRAPYLSVSRETSGVLEACGYTWDSSVGSRRFDFGLGRVNSPKALFAPTRPYTPSRERLWARGSAPLVEVPCTAILAPYSLTTARVFGPGLFGTLQGAVARLRDPVVFLMHPWELVEDTKVDHGRTMPPRHRRRRGAAAQDIVRGVLDAWADRRSWVPCGALAAAAKASA